MVVAQTRSSSGPDGYRPVWAGDCAPEPSSSVQGLAAGVGRPHRRNAARPRPADDPRTTLAYEHATRDHRPTRPTWTCHNCGKPWPCDPARERLLRLVPALRLAVMMNARLEQAAGDLRDVPPGELWIRFVAWTRRPSER